MKSHLNFTYKVIYHGKVISKCQTHALRRFYHRIRTIKWRADHFSVYLRVMYERSINNQGNMVSFYNDGEYKTAEELLFALNAFTEK